MIHLVMFKQKKENCWYGFHYDLLRMKQNKYWRYGRKRPSNQNKISSKYLWNSHLVSVNINSKFHGRKNWWAGITKTLLNQFLWTLGTYKKKQKNEKRQNETYKQKKQSIRNKINKNKQNKEKDTNRQRHRTEKKEYTQNRQTNK